MPNKAEQASKTHDQDREGSSLSDDRYARLLELRAATGAKLFDGLAHGQHEGMQAINDECHALDDILSADARYESDFDTVVVVAEQARIHVPGEERPIDNATRPCAGCRRHELDLGAAMVLPFRDVA